MKKWTFILILILVVVIIMAVGGYLYMQGYFKNTEWQTLVMIFAAIAAPAKAMINKFKTDDMGFTTTNKPVIEEENSTSNSAIETQSKKVKNLHSELETKLKTKEGEIGKLNLEIELLESKMQLIKKEKENLNKVEQIQNMPNNETVSFDAEAAG